VVYACRDAVLLLENPSRLRALRSYAALDRGDLATALGLAKKSTGFHLKIASLPTTTTPLPTTSRVSYETHEIATARSDLRHGSAENALNRLTRLEHDVENGVLNEEREALIVECLWQVSKQAEARAAARQFIANHRESVHIRRIEAIAKH
jgi:DNA-binding transcriptional ArsR family regulator